MLGRICMNLKPEEIICSAMGDTKFKAKYVEEENSGLKYRKFKKIYKNSHFRIFFMFLIISCYN